MLRMYLLQIWFNLSDEGIEDAIYDSYCMRKFMGIDFISETVPDATTLLKFRHLLEKHDIGKAIFDDIKGILEKQGLIMHGGTIVDATLVEAPSSTKNETGKRDPEMHQTKKGNQWHFGMKVHIDADAGTGYVHTIAGTSANVHYLDEVTKLILNWEKKSEHWEASVRCKVEHAFLIVKRDFGYRKVVYKGIKKNLHRFHMLFACANLLMYIRSGHTESLNAA